MPSLSSLVVSLIAVGFVPPFTTAAAGPAALERSAAAQGTTTERARMGLLPRRAVRSRVTYLSGAAGPGKVAAPLASLDERPVTLVIEDVDDAGAASRPSLVPVADPVPATEADGTSGEAAPAAVAPAVEAAAAVVASPQEAATAALPSPDPSEGRAQAVGAAKEAAARTGPDAVAVERVIDAQGEVIVRVKGAGAAVLGERVVGSLVDLPVLTSERQGDGAVVQTVKDEWGLIEVHRDPLGRFVSARTLEARAAAD